MLTVKTLISDYSVSAANELRVRYWKDIATRINAGEYGLVCKLLCDHNVDYDYARQCEAVVNSIAIHYGREAHPDSDRQFDIEHQ